MTQVTEKTNVLIVRGTGHKRASMYLSYRTEDEPSGGFWLVVGTDDGEISLLLSPEFIRREIFEPPIERLGNIPI